jgi:hypothetical protein
MPAATESNPQPLPNPKPQPQQASALVSDQVLARGGPRANSGAGWGPHGQEAGVTEANSQEPNRCSSSLVCRVQVMPIVWADTAALAPRTDTIGSSLPRCTVLRLRPFFSGCFLCVLFSETALHEGSATASRSTPPDPGLIVVPRPTSNVSPLCWCIALFRFVS